MKMRSSNFSIARLIGFVLNGLTRISPRLAGQVAFRMLGSPRKKKQKLVEQAFLATADMHFETVNGQKIAVYHWGFRGPVAFLAHGWESHAGRWRKVAPLLVQAGFQVIAVDAPAHGRSGGRFFTMIRYADVLRTLFQRLGPVDAIVAHSVGGAASIWAMGTISPALRPKKAVILASFCELQTIMDGARDKVGASEALMRAMDDQIERLTGARIPHYSLLRQAEKLEQVDTLLIHDRDDRVTAVMESEKLHRAWPDSQFIRTEGLGHGLTAPVITETIVDFVQAGILC